MDSKADSDEEFFDCISDIKYCAIASPQGKGHGEVFMDLKKAHEKWKQVKGARMKVFSDYNNAQKFASTPVKAKEEEKIYPPSPKADVESTPYSSVTQGALLQLRTLIEKGNVNGMRQAVDENPMTLVTSSDTPTLIQVRLRYNALHVAAAAGVADAVDFLLSRLNSPAFWKQIYPGTDDQTSAERQRHVTDLYLNSPELGNLETPLHFACKFGHLNCVRLLISHPLTQLDALNRSGQRPTDVICTRLGNRAVPDALGNLDPTARSAALTSSIRRLFDQYFVVLADVQSTPFADSHVTILSPCSLRQLQAVLAQTLDRSFPNLAAVVPYFSVLIASHEPLGSNHHGPKTDRPRTVDLANLGMGDGMFLTRIRAIAGPMSLIEAKSFRSKWMKANSTAKQGTFASIRLTDPEKGYERQGRYFSKLFGTLWFEYWEFLDDFVDLASERGLELLEQYLSTDQCRLQLPRDLLCNDEKSSVTQHRRSSKTSHAATNSRTSTDCNETNTRFLQLGADGEAPQTPVTRARHTLPSNCRSSSSPNNPADNLWYSHRSHSSNGNLLNDSLEESSDGSELPSYLEELDRTLETPPVTRRNSFSPLSPIVGLLEKLTFRSPLRWLLVSRSGCGEPLFHQPDSPLGDSIHSTASPSTRTLPSNVRKSCTKRRMSALDSDDLTRNIRESEQPAAKKRSPVKRPIGFVQARSNLPSLFRHICRALPAGDPELETAVAALACADAEANGTGKPTSSSDCPAPRWLRSTSLSKFHAVSNWKRLVEDFNAHLSHDPDC